MSHKRKAAENVGRRAEAKAAWWLRLHGWRIMDQRVKTPRGEVDLVARRGGTVAFVEVKARKSVKALGDAIDEYRLRRVAAAVSILAPKYAPNGEDIRIDVMLLAPWRLPHHLPNVWHGG
ncbi:YraN family protein [Sphingorhabdus sp. Alg239-R122]|uniref:YraN family protein n=1 Tax=Sphingorhabdus sp. Alg239-R122 TaxID=2305989 RepID=UPI0013DC6500|nr:YraN family protein [Sphingorhabdus sp. Alg239-R122]